MEFWKRLLPAKRQKTPDGKVFLITNYDPKCGSVFAPEYIPLEDTFASRLRWIRTVIWNQLSILCCIVNRNEDLSTSASKADDRNKQRFLCGYTASNVVKTSKYTIISFLPCVLLFQMTKIANLFYLSVSFLQLNSDISDSNGIPTYVIPVIFVMLVCLARELADEIARWRCDEEENSRPVHVFRDGRLQELKLKQIRVGDIVKIHAFEYFPSDLVLLNCSDEQGICSIETKNADGESNMKYKYVNTELANLFQNDEDAANVQIALVCDAPSDRLDSFSGTVSYCHEDLQDTQKRCLEKHQSFHKTYSNIPFSTADTLDVPIKTVKLTMNQFLLRGTSMVSTEWAYCVAVYVGSDTRLMKGSIAQKRRKLSKLEKLYEKLLLKVVAIMFVFVVFCAILSVFWTWKQFSDHHYLTRIITTSPVKTFFVSVGSCALLLSAILPVDLIMIWEFVRVFQARQIKMNDDMISKVDGKRASSKSDHLVEELGNVTHVYSDKTGTLTQNKMELVCLGFSQFGYFKGDDWYGDFLKMCRTHNSQLRELLKYFIVALSVCHSVVVPRNNITNGCTSRGPIPLKRRNNRDRILLVDPPPHTAYDAASPDELALVLFSRAIGCIFTSRDCITEIEITLTTPEVQELLFNDEELNMIKSQQSKTDNMVPAIRYLICDVLQFDSDRRTMSVVVEDPNGGIFCLTKGADSALSKAMKHTQNIDVDLLNNQILDFATFGFRTLVYGYKAMNLDEYEKWHKKYTSALSDGDATSTKISECAMELESNLTILCASGIEDRLQDEVADVLRDLQEAGIIVWVITGDKLETALSISRSTGLLTEDVYNVILDNQDPNAVNEMLHQHLENCINGLKLIPKIKKQKESRKRFYSADYRRSAVGINMPMESTKLSTVLDTEFEKFAITTTGEVLDIIYQCENLKNMFFTLAKYACTVIACRTTHKQKALLASDNTKFNENSTSLAIGDGANDVGMILAADIGVGIMGKEGLQASRSADFAIGEFRFLRHLLFVHGKETFRKNMFLLYYCIFRNFCLSFINVIYNFFCGFSGVSVFNTWSKQIINLCFTSFPLIAYVIMDSQLPHDLMIKYPSLYSTANDRPIINFIRKSLQPYENHCLTKWLLKKINPLGIYVWADFYGLLIAAFWFTTWETIILIKTLDTTFYSIFDGNALNFGFNMFSHVLYIHHVFAVNGVFALITNIWYWQSHLALWGETFLLLLFWGLSSIITAFTTIPEAHIFYGSFDIIHSAIIYVVALFITLIISLLPFWGYLYYLWIFNLPAEHKIALEMKQGTFGGVCPATLSPNPYLSNVPIEVNRVLNNGFAFAIDVMDVSFRNIQRNIHRNVK